MAAVKKSEESVSPNDFLGTATGQVPRNEAERADRSGNRPAIEGKNKTFFAVSKIFLYFFFGMCYSNQAGALRQCPTAQCRETPDHIGASADPSLGVRVIF